MKGARETGQRLGVRVAFLVLEAVQSRRALRRATAPPELAQEAEAQLAELEPEGRRLALLEAAHVVELLAADLAEEAPGPWSDAAHAVELKGAADHLRRLAAP